MKYDIIQTGRVETTVKKWGDYMQSQLYLDNDMQNRKNHDAFNLSAAFIDCGLLISAREHDKSDPPYQTAANNVNTS